MSREALAVQGSVKSLDPEARSNEERAAPTEHMADAVDAALFRAAFRTLAGGVAVVTVGAKGERSGFTATSVSSFSATPPTVVFSLRTSSSSFPLIDRYRTVGVNFLSGLHQPIAEAFAGFGGRAGEARYAGLHVETQATGAPLLSDAAASLDCRVSEIIIRHQTALVLARVVGVRISKAISGLVYRDGKYGSVGAAHLDSPLAGLGDWQVVRASPNGDPGLNAQPAIGLVRAQQSHGGSGKSNAE